MTAEHLYPKAYRLFKQVFLLAQVLFVKYNSLNILSWFTLHKQTKNHTKTLFVN